MQADLIIINGNVITMDEKKPRAEAVAVKDGLITYVGKTKDALSWKSKETEIRDVSGKTVMPGFIESHMHPTHYGLNLLEIDCRPESAPTIHAILQKIKELAARIPKGEWIRGWGWDDSKLKEGRIPTRWELDQAAPNHPVVLKRTCNHMVVVNSLALAISDITKETNQPVGGHIERDDETAEPTGLLQEKAQGMVAAPEYDLEEMEKGMKLAQQDFVKWGITTVHDMATQNLELALYQQMLSKKQLKVRVRPWIWAIDQNGWKGLLEEVVALGIRSGFGNNMLRIQGVKYMLDGSVGGRTAAVAQPYEKDEKLGILYNDVDEIAPLFKQSLEAGLRVAVHGIGERAIEVALKAFEIAAKHLPIQRMRNRIEHCALPTENQLERMKQLELIAASSIGFLYHIGDSYLTNLGKERMNRVYPHRLFRDYGIIAPGNSDLPVTGGNPFTGIYAAITRKSITGQVLDEIQNISLDEALRAYTTDAAYSSWEEDLIGALQPSAHADMIILSHDPYEISPEQLLNIEVEQTFIGGQAVFSKESETVKG
ncbi:MULTISPECIES: amidohydrolase [Virgibacillus]|uniref:amidohydrolase n=1 Tax=Virgibacillus TaxID=84406 RepID=UPI000388936B|nr:MULTISPECIES: amidohydrolase [Virgibacillus]EQB34654.1 hypothetical protein M948_19905 [Virgibacillus sp. CM-4]MYL43687.1 amidohydrolase family protein [Virgibacillus massiliensis]